MDFTPSLAEVLQSAEPLIAVALAEDIGLGDVTTRSILPPGSQSRATILVKEEGVIAGLPVAKAVFQKVDPKIEFKPLVVDGAKVKPTSVVANLSGPTASILTAERTALNFLQHLSGIATLTAAFVAAVAGTRTVILDTRKTTPGFRLLEKYAVRLGGGRNHRRGLYDMLLVKDNHIHATGPLSLTVRRARDAHPSLLLEVEVTSLEQLKEALSMSVDRIMLDNMDLETIRQAVRMGAGRVPFEVSGGVSLENVRAIAATGVDFISVGALTHSSMDLDLSLELYPG
jgi:nicotinate-nucleotide pyrophosphorylase (carboxylating)